VHSSAPSLTTSTSTLVGTDPSTERRPRAHLAAPALSERAHTYPPAAHTYPPSAYISPTPTPAPAPPVLRAPRPVPFGFEYIGGSARPPSAAERVKRAWIKKQAPRAPRVSSADADADARAHAHFLFSSGPPEDAGPSPSRSRSPPIGRPTDVRRTGSGLRGLVDPLAHPGSPSPRRVLSPFGGRLDAARAASVPPVTATSSAPASAAGGLTLAMPRATRSCGASPAPDRRHIDGVLAVLRPRPKTPGPGPGPATRRIGAPFGFEHRESGEALAPFVARPTTATATVSSERKVWRKPVPVFGDEEAVVDDTDPADVLELELELGHAEPSSPDSTHAVFGWPLVEDDDEEGEGSKDGAGSARADTEASTRPLVHSDDRSAFFVNVGSAVSGWKETALDSDESEGNTSNGISKALQFVDLPTEAMIGHGLLRGWPEKPKATIDDRDVGSAVVSDDRCELQIFVRRETVIVTD
jgi:hypothetical protein